MSTRPRNKGRRPWRRIVAIAVSAAATIVTPAVTGTPAHAGPATPHTTAPLTVAQAVTQARASGTGVVAGAADTSTDTLTANPDGTMTLTRTALPTRRLVTGVWTALDATLHATADGALSPAVSADPLTLSGGGNGPAVVMRTATGRSLALTLPMPLPRPTVSGATATYPAVLPGVDLELTADTQGGFREVLIVHDASAATNPQLRTLTLATATSGVSIAADQAGNLRAVDGKGQTVFAAPAPILWDSAAATPAATVTDPSGLVRDATTGLPTTSTPAGPGEGAHTAAVGVAVTAGAIALTPDPALLTSPTTSFPVFIDPGWSNGKTGWASVSEYHPGSNYWNNTPDPTPGLAQVGNSGSMWSHTLINFPIPSTLGGAAISSATFTITEVVSFSCTPSTVEVFAPSTTLTSGNATWNAWSGVSLGAAVATQNVAHGYNSSCPAAGVGFDVSAAVASALSAGRNTQTLVMTGVNESSDHNSWKEFSAASATIAITYDHPPAAPTGMTTSPATSCGSPPTTVGDANLTLYAPVADPDNENNLSVTFQVGKFGRNGFAAIDTATVTYPSGSTAVHVVPKATLDAAAASGVPISLSWQVQVSDGSQTSAWSTGCGFVFDPTRTGQPGVTPPATITIGQPATFAVTPPPTGTAPGSYLYQLNGDPYGQVTASSGSASITVHPTRTTNTLTVTGVSAGGNIGDTASTTFNATPPATPQADQDLSGDNIPDLHVVGAGTIPAGLWTAQGQSATTGAGQVVGPGHNVGINGNAVAADNSPTDFNGAQVTTGHYSGGSLQDVLTYYPAGVNAGMALIFNGTGDGSPFIPVSGSFYKISAGTFTDDNGDPLQLVNAGNASGQSPTYPDLLGTSGDPTSGYYLNYYPNGGARGAYASIDALSAVPTPANDMAWNNWTITTCQVNNQTDMYLWNRTTGALYLWTNLTHTPGGTDLNHTQYAIATNWNTGAALTLQAADVNTDGTPDLWTVNAATGTVTAYPLVTFPTNPTLTAQPGQALITAAHQWPFDDNTSGAVGTATDVAQNLTATGAAGATWTTDGPSAHAVTLDGATGKLQTSAPAFDAGNDFTVSVWARPASGGGYVLSQDENTGTASKGFGLYSDGTHWNFTLSRTSGASPYYDTVTQPGSEVLGVWVHLTVTYQKSTGLMVLYVNDTEAATASHPTSWASPGPYQIGDAELNSGQKYGGYFNGEISNVQVWNQIVDPTATTGPVGHWPLTEGAGGTAADTGTTNAGAPSNHPVTLGGSAAWTSGHIVGTNAATFNGTTAYAQTGGAVTRTDQSFSVAAWVRLSSTYPYATVTAQQGTHQSGLVLQHISGGGWALAVQQTDTVGPTVVRAVSGQNSVAGAWTHLVGVYNAGAGQIRLYVNGQLSGTASVTIGWNASGPLQIGREWHDDAYTSYFPGDISDVQIWNRTVTDNEIAALAAPAQVAAWQLNDGTGTTARDDTGHHPGTLTTGAQFTTTGHNGADPGGLHLDGTTGSMTTTTALIRTDQSFSVAAWVRLSSTFPYATVTGQQGTHQSGVLLQHLAGAGWALTVQQTDTVGATVVRAVSSQNSVAGVWTHLVGVYDAPAGQIRLYVNGQLSGTASVSIGWNAPGAFQLGREWHDDANTSYFPGDIDAVHLYQGVLTTTQIQGLATS